MAKDPAFLFYPGDWLGGTIGMTFEEKGAYIDLLVTQFNRGHMTEHMIGQVVGQLWVKLQDKFVKDQDGLWYNKKLEDEQMKRKAFTQSRFNNKMGKNQYTKKGGHMTSHMEDGNGNKKGGVGESFSEDGEFAVFSDGTKQKLGKMQKIRLGYGELTPNEVVRGKSY